MVRADDQGAVREWREHRFGGGYGGRFVRVLANWEDEASVAALCDGAADELDHLQLRFSGAGCFGDRAGWGEHDVVSVSREYDEGDEALVEVEDSRSGCRGQSYEGY